MNAPSLDVFTYITGLAGVLGLILQLKDAFPEHRESRKAIVLLTLGVFIGSLIGSVKNISPSSLPNLSPISLLSTAVLGILAIVVVAAIFSNDKTKRQELYNAAGVGVGALLLILFFGTLVHLPERDKLTIDELLEISHQNAEKSNYDRAVILLEMAESKLTADDARMKPIKDKIAELKSRQVRSK